MKKLDAESIRAALAVCEGAKEGPWESNVGNVVVLPGEPEGICYVYSANDGLPHDQDVAFARYIAATRDPTTGYEAALRALLLVVKACQAVIDNHDKARLPSLADYHRREAAKQILAALTPTPEEKPHG